MIQKFADWLVFSVIGLDNETALGSAVNFFVYDSIKILLLLFLISALMGIVNAYFPVERLRNYLSSHKLYGLQYLLASLWSDNAILLLFIHPFVHWIRQRGNTAWGYFFVPYHVTACQ